MKTLTTNHKFKAACLLIVSLGLSACTTFSNASSNDIVHINNDEAATAADGPTPSPTTEFTPPPLSPIDEFMAYVEGTNLSLEAQVRQREIEYAEDQELIAACMAEQGFTYFPDQFMEFSVSAGEPWRTNDPDWIMQHGFGVITMPEPGPGTVGGSNMGTIGQHDPNFEHTQSLSEAERAAHFRALNGAINPYRSSGAICLGDGCPTEPPDEIEIAASMEFHNDPANWGCQQKVWEARQAASPRSLQQTDEFLPLFEAIDRFRSDLQLSATEADRDWAACMAGIGYTEFQRRPDFYDVFRPQLVELSDEIIAQMVARGEQVWRWPLGRGDAPEIDALFDREVETALADLECRNATDFDAGQQAAIFEAEAQFVNDHRAAFEALRAAAEQLSGQ